MSHAKIVAILDKRLFHAPNIQWIVAYCVRDEIVWTSCGRYGLFFLVKRNSGTLNRRYV